MVLDKPHFLLFCDSHIASRKAEAPPAVGRWHFVLERLDVSERLEATDTERAVPRDRLSLLAVVRGLEALEQPSAVTLVTTSRYVSRGLRYGLGEWREANYSWEHFGVQKPIRNADLWQRVDCALHYHHVDCRLLESVVIGNQGEDVPLEETPVENVVPAPHFRPRPAPRGLTERSGEAWQDPSWWVSAAGWMQWWKRRGARNSLLAGV